MAHSTFIKFFIFFALFTFSVSQQASLSEAMWLFQDLPGLNQTVSSLLDQIPKSSVQTTQQLDTKQDEQATYQQSMSPFSIAGIRPASIASLLNTVSDTGFSYFNVHDQCRSRTACDVGFMLYKKLNFIHNWIIRTSVRTLVDTTNVYSIAWTNGMLGKNCTLIYPACSQSPLESLMSFALLAS